MASRSDSFGARPPLRTLMHRLRKSFVSRPRFTALLLMFFNLAMLVAFLLTNQSVVPAAALANAPHDGPVYLGRNSLHQLSPLQSDVRKVTRTMFQAYMHHCAGKDEYIPASESCSDWFEMGLTILDSLDTLLLMDLHDEYQSARAWAEEKLSFNISYQTVSTFELVIRVTGGLNSAYLMTGDGLWLRKSVELADMLLPSFELSKTGCPPSAVYVGANSKEKNKASYHRHSNPAEAGTLQLEFRTLSQMTGDKKYAAVIDKCMDTMIKNIPEDNLVSVSFDLDSGDYIRTRIGLGGSIDSFYEMMVKTWIAFGKRDDALRAAFEKSVEAIFKNLVREENGYMFIGEYMYRRPVTFKKTMDHLACFFPGTLAIAAQHGLGGGLHGTRETDYMPRARQLARSCYAMTQGPYGLAPEITDFSVKPPRFAESHGDSQLRPEVVEAMYYMDKLDPLAGRRYKDWGSDMWKRIRTFAQVPGREDGILSSTWKLGAETKEELKHVGKLHSFVLAETFKYFFLLFDERPAFDGPFPLDRWVYNTEAHPVPIVSG